MNILEMLKNLRKENKISRQQFKTYRGQILSGDLEGAIRGLQRNNLIANK